MNMNSLLDISRSGLNGFQRKMDTIGNNIANVNTTGFKARDLNFEELLNNQTTTNEVGLSKQARKTGINMGVGTQQANINLQQGALADAPADTDLAIQGSGFFGVRVGNQLLLTRDGSFKRDATGNLVTENGATVAMTKNLPTNKWPNGKLQIAQDGKVSIINNQDKVIQVGRINLYNVTKPTQLSAVGQNLYTTDATNIQQTAAGGANGLILQNKLENSTVSLANEMTDMMITQRAYALNTRVAQASDTMLNITNQFND
ncbi:flagellar hook-basal body protein [Periweissella beninensis]|uniref:Flagellar hook-basal body protein n=1 Tax=Periweissella beninensis TaxID=504936 RepID=A0ABT0VGJ2_9LACO|nr:flagellar hook-basal body protein [Periweissella beninensis]MBM7544711.1 flagellar basal-body rod protein FlgG [Periweissella beninensis]MCM2436949.1 flagellar hook-basal body protein [Periweissella beninensis]MCT4396336.1 flagellar hook-basal body protein [Periweissella beninensis]